MKWILNVLLFLPFFTSAQDYEPFLDTMNRWVLNTSYSDHYSILSVNQERLFFYDGDTLLSNERYHKVMYNCGVKRVIERNMFGDLISDEETMNPCGTQLFALIREDTALKKVFIHESEIHFFDSCNAFIANTYFDDSDAKVGERLLMDFNLVQPVNEEKDSVVINSWYRHHLLNMVYLNYNMDTTGFVGMYINQKSENENFEEIGVSIYFGNNGIGIGTGVGYFNSVFFPISMCQNEYWRRETDIICFSHGDFRRQGFGDYSMEPNKQCELRLLNSISDLESRKRSLFVQNPVVDKSLSFFRPLFGELIVQDPSGAIVIQKMLGGELDIQLNDLSKGVFLVQIHTDDGHFLFERVLVK